ncbi:MAG TPA: DUF4231 domain-containing protein [Chitinophagales bacterium]|nr:DUF4231 domain-containing protein [Chitinophagales bacterium]
MNAEEFKDYVDNRYTKQMDYYSKASAKNQQMYKRFQWTLIILSALTPVLAGVGDKCTILHYVVIIISAVVAILTTGLKTFQFQELWIIYRTTYERLKPEIHYYHSNSPPYNTTGADKEALFVQRVEDILAAEHSQWPAGKAINNDKK